MMLLRGMCGWVLVVMAGLSLALPAAAETGSQDDTAGNAARVVAEDAGDAAEVVFLEPQPLTEVDTGASSEEGEKRNPFATTEYLERKRLSPPEPKRQTFQALATPGKLPKMKLKGHLQGMDNETLALLEIEGGEVHLVREGDTVGLHDLGFPGAIRIKKINRLHLVVESGSYGQLIIVR